MLLRFTLLILLLPLFQGCSSIARGITEAVLEQDNVEYQRKCQVFGRPFEGLEKAWSNQQPDEIRELRLLVVHGAGNYRSGYADAMNYSIAERLGLTRVDARPLSIDLPQGKSLGVEYPSAKVAVTRFRNAQNNRQLLVFELSYVDITRQDKMQLAFDESSAMTNQRVAVNKQLKEMLNMHASDPMIYLGPTGDLIRGAVSQTMCMMLRADWNQLTSQQAVPCDENYQHKLPDNTHYAIVTHSMGSRVVIDVLQDNAETSVNKASFEPLFKERRLPVFMLSNQLQLMQLGRTAPNEFHQERDYCSAHSADFDKRLVRDLELISITDPNDIFSYTVPQSFVDEFVDARLCPSLINVVTQVAVPINILGMTELAEPMTAHKGYFSDTKVLDVIAFGLNGALLNSEGHASCRWNDVVED
ncbi:hypothetical protein [Echinimonas agarilytica]|uniref:Alpha/beta hydrolase family protein n=1 Tax=Echinimonas agarilytica TaxID=1215918 RepID=A0AA42B776_9GAMM|nr:hypothetical protein [Echinimonas agarilytica]MCM2678923.1 hypothetical protein [Echinimonas agarilytica]